MITLNDCKSIDLGKTVVYGNCGFSYKVVAMWVDDKNLFLKFDDSEQWACASAFSFVPPEKNDLKEEVFYYDYKSKRYFNSLEDAAEEYKKDIEAAPSYLFPCYKKKFERISAEDILRPIMEEYYENKYDALLDFYDLQEFINKWCDKQTLEYYVVDTTKRIVFQEFFIKYLNYGS